MTLAEIHSYGSTLLDGARKCYELGLIEEYEFDLIYDMVIYGD